MANRTLTKSELEVAQNLLNSIRQGIAETAKGDEGLVWALRRKVYKELMYDERGKPMARKMLKMKTAIVQKGLCALCKGDLPELGAVLDRLEAMKGYVTGNVRLLCPKCDFDVQKSRGFA